jgi:PhoH-like ATPase
VTLVDLLPPAHTELACFNAVNPTWPPLQRATKVRLGAIHSRNREQTFAHDVPLDPVVPPVTLLSKAGTGKALLTLAAGLPLVARVRV